MNITVASLSDQVFPLNVSEDLELENLKAFCEVESGVPAHEIQLSFNGMPLTDNKKTLKEYGIKEGDMLILQQISERTPSQRPSTASGGAAPAGGLSMPMFDFSNIQIPSNVASTSRQPSGAAGQMGLSSDDPAVIREMLLADPSALSMLKQNNPRLADALTSGSLEKFAQVLKEQQEAKAERERLRLRMLNADPFDAEAQRLIADEIRQKNIEANMEAAMEYNPETFGTVVMLYINCFVNGHPVKAFIDSGAQTTIMSAECAERCNIMRLVDHRWAGYAKGVGIQRIIGRVHMVQIQIEKDFLTSSFSILEQQKMDMLLGLDMLKRHQCTIDLKRNILHIGTTGTETPFLAEGDLPECARLSGSDTMDEQKVLEESLRQAEHQQMAEAMERSQQSSSAAGPSGRLSDPATTIMPGDAFTEATVKEIMALGFNREQVISELRRFKGDKTQATAALFAKSLKF
ncbi:protein DDI1 homolog 2 isoform X2 [Neocloeon triangulifer]|uniref:protein DDI1 homolog 2 isoform X2 n=1 Tax=Neocloeon triangulifer TaxID=2078957 RepID=UPI00286F9D4E|nr:protein DDI1 homolog 2 isoform X2 [Neocloeon triangulifer]